MFSSHELSSSLIRRECKQMIICKSIVMHFNYCWNHLSTSSVGYFQGVIHSMLVSHSSVFKFWIDGCHTVDTIYQLTVPAPNLAWLLDMVCTVVAVNFYCWISEFWSKFSRLGKDKKVFYDYLAELMFTIKSEVQQVYSRDIYAVNYDIMSDMDIVPMYLVKKSYRTWYKQRELLRITNETF